jgi:hypothetical protein
MRFFDKLAARFERWRQDRHDAALLRKANNLLAEGFKAPEGSVAHVYANPEMYNRRTRRSVGYRRPTGLLTAQHVGLYVQQDPVGLVPRYARRHRDALDKPRTSRRVRRHQARVIRSLVRAGIAP